MSDDTHSENSHAATGEAAPAQTTRSNGVPGAASVVVGLGASAGGIEALEAFFAGLPEIDGIAFVVILHLAPDEESYLADVLQSGLPLPVTQVTESVAVEPGHVYVIPPNKNLLIEDGHLVLEPIETERVERRPIDHFFRTLADAYGPHAVGIILSGTGANGTVGARRLRETGGCVMAQDPEDAQFDEMPRTAIAAGIVDVIGTAGQLAAEATAYAERLHRVQLPETPEALPEDGQKALQGVLAQLRARTGHDFAHYKRSTVLRRLDRRLHVTGTDSLAAYLDHLRSDAGEAAVLLDDLLISVTNFFRDPEAFAALEAAVPGLFEGKGPGGEVRVWVAGCATGEEAYSLAMLLLEHAPALAESPRIQVFATDLSEAAVRTARVGIYPASIEADVSAERLRRFFVHGNGHYRVGEALREAVLFAPHSLLNDPPFSRLDLVSCRNLLIYLQRDLQKQVLALFHYALRPGGLLFLGTSESADGDTDLFGTLDKRARLYRRLDVETPAPQFPHVPRVLAEPPRPLAAPGLLPPRAEPLPDKFERLHQVLRAETAPPSVLVNEANEVVHVSDGATPFLQVTGGTPTRSLAGLLRPELRPGVQAALFQARHAGRSVEAGPVGLTVGGEAVSVGFQARPAEPHGGKPHGGKPHGGSGGLVQIVFETHPAEQQPVSVSEHDADLAAALEAELEQAREQVRATIEEFETSREELRSQNEELQSVNEELRSTGEELETAKEEAQSIAEELRTVNDELKAKVDETARAKGDLENLIVSTEIATLFLDRGLRIKRFTPHVRDHFRVLASDLGRPLEDLAQKFGGVRLVEDAEAVLERLEVKEREIEGAGGRWYLVHLRPYRTPEDRIDGVVITFVDITERKRSEEDLRRSEERYRLLVEGTTEYAILMLDAEGRIAAWNTGAEAVFGYAEREAVGQPGTLLFTEEDRAAGRLEAEMETALREGQAADDRWHVRRDGTRFWASGVMTPLRRPDGSLRGFAKVLRDNTLQKEAAEDLRASEERLHLALEASAIGTHTYSVADDRHELDDRAREIVGDDAFTLGAWFDRIHPDDRDRVEAAAARALAGGDGVFDEEYRLTFPEGEVRWVYVRSRTVFAPAGASGEERRPERVVGTVQDVTEQHRAEEAIRRLNQTLEERVEERTREVRALSARLAIAEQEERQRVAQLLHDDLQQQLFGLGLTLGLVRSARSEAEADELFDQIEQIHDQATALTRSLVVELSPPVLESTQLEDILRWLAFHKEEQHGLAVEVEVEGPCEVPFRPARVLLYQVLQEVLFNVVKHAGTRHARLRAWQESGQAVVEIGDDGDGFDVDTLEDRPQAGGGFGLPSVRERVEQVGGRVEIVSVPGDGTRVTIRVPVSGPEHRDA